MESERKAEDLTFTLGPDEVRESEDLSETAEFDAAGYNAENSFSAVENDADEEEATEDSAGGTNRPEWLIAYRTAFRDYLWANSSKLISGEEPLLRLDWKVEQTPHYLEVRITEFFQNTFSFEYTGSTLSKPATFSPCKFYIYIDAPSRVKIGVYIGGLPNRKTSMLVNSEAQPDEPCISVIAKPTNVPVLKDFGTAFFPANLDSEQEESSKAGLRVTKRSGFAWERGSDGLRYFPHMRSNEQWEADQPQSAGEVFEPNEDFLRVLAAHIAWTALINIQIETKNPDHDKISSLRKLLPSDRRYTQRTLRPVDLTSDVVGASLKRANVTLPQYVIDAVCTSLNTGKHIILTGPPGCGKTVLAATLAREIARNMDAHDGLVATASPSWTTHDLIGRYFPRTDGRGLRFQEGLFLRAVREGRTLVLDEFNRAPIDECFGEIFTVLSGQSVTLPYEYLPKDSAESTLDAPRNLRILTSRPEDWDGHAADYLVSPRFRIIATMNDFDRSSLASLSYALLRRFDIIRLDAPAPDVVQTILDRKISSITRPEDQTLAYVFEHRRTERNALQYLAEGGRRKVRRLFANTNTDQRDLIVRRAVGVATVLDVVTFLAEGFRALHTNPKVYCESEDDLEATFESFLAMALLHKVVPQLDALVGEEQRDALEFIASSLSEELPLTRIIRTSDENDKSLSGDAPYAADQRAKRSVRAHFKQEVCSHMRDPHYFDPNRY